MPIPALTLTIAGAITEAIFGYALAESGLAETLRNKLGRNPTKLAYKQGLAHAIEDFKDEYAEWYAALFDASFFEHEGAPVLAQFLLPNGEPDATELALRWAASLPGHDDERRRAHAQTCEPAAYVFLGMLGERLKEQADLRDLNNERRFEQIATDMARLLDHFNAGRATPMTRRAYLQWLIDANLYLDPRGARQTQRQVQLKLDDIYVSLRARPEVEPQRADRQLLQAEQTAIERELETGRISAAEAEERRDLLWAKVERTGISDAPATPLDLYKVVTDHERLVILGDPGSGKTTLLRHLALQQALALGDGRAVGAPHPRPALGKVAFPVLARIAEYAEDGRWKRMALSAFLPTAFSRGECPSAGLGDLLAQELDAGGCLLLLDGLDEIVSADDRRGVVNQIEAFVRQHARGGQRGPNRFIITSRIAGYRSAPLSGVGGAGGKPIAHYVVQEMGVEEIRHFLKRWCPAVEDAETPEKSPAARRQTAQREIDAIMDAVERNPGVRRLAANPLLLSILALIQRTGAQLPRRRIELYKLAADTLARTWRTAQGVPESALVDERYLTSMLGRMAYWMHVHKPSGLATEREVYDVLGAAWAKIKRRDWDPDDPDLEVVAEVDNFLLRVREHTGLFVERAPRRYGFMHLTFEEYYAARYLTARRRQTAALIRKHLHDPRWDEPILLALGFVGLDYPEEAEELLRTAILAEGEEAEELGFAPSAYEELLGRDYLFALRCIGDLIPADAATIDALTVRLSGELLHGQGPARFTRYHAALEKHIGELTDTQLATTVQPILLATLKGSNKYARCLAAQSLGQLGQASPEVIDVLLATLKDLLAWDGVRLLAAQSLGRLGQASPEVIDALIVALKDIINYSVRRRAAQSLGQLGQASPGVTDALLAALKDSDEDVRSLAAQSLVQLGQTSLEVIHALLAALKDVNYSVRRWVTQSLGQLGQASPEVIDALLAALRDSDEDVRSLAAQSLGQLGQASPEVIDALLAALKDLDWDVRRLAAQSLSQLGPDSPGVTHALLVALRNPDEDVRRLAAQSLGNLGQASPEVIDALLSALKDLGDYVRRRATQSLGQLGQASPEVIDALLVVLKDPDDYVRRQVVQSLGQLGQASSEVMDALLAALKDPDDYVCSLAAHSLGQLGHASPEVMDVLLAALKDSDWNVRGLATRGLVEFGQASPAITAALLAALKESDFDIRRRAAQCLGQLGQPSPEVMAALLAALKDSDSSVRSLATQSLGQLGQASPEVIDALLVTLKESTSSAYSSTAQSLIQLGKADEDVWAELCIQLAQLAVVPVYVGQDNGGRSSQDYAHGALWGLVVGDGGETT